MGCRSCSVFFMPSAAPGTRPCLRKRWCAVRRGMGALICLIMAAGMLTAKDAGSPEELVKDVLQALQDKDSAALNDLAVTESEFKQSVWALLTFVNGSRTASSYFKDIYQPTSRQV